MTHSPAVVEVVAEVVVAVVAVVPEVAGQATRVLPLVTHPR